MQVHELGGCAPAPLAHYLKALGILRLVAEQADPQARGWWEGERFKLATVMDRAQLEAYFLDRYKPTPLVSPWNKGAGFFQANDMGLAPIEAAKAARMATFQQGIAASRRLLNGLAAADADVRRIKGESKQPGLSKAQRDVLRALDSYKARLAAAERAYKELKAELIPNARLQWRGLHRRWLDAALVLDDLGMPRYPALLGTGGNDGRLDFTNNFMQRLNDVFDLSTPEAKPRGVSRAWLAGALWAQPTAACLPGRAVGQFFPGAAGGANSVNGPQGDSLLNPFDFILSLEGALLLTSQLSKRLDTDAPQRASAPFVASAHAAGYPSAGNNDESARGEQWMPLWDRPQTLVELQRLFAEGRVQVGRKASSQPFDMARAVARLGVARGIVAFERFGFIERNGQSNLAVPIGRFSIQAQAGAHLDCLDDLAAWFNRLRREASGDDGSVALQQATRVLGDALLELTQHSAQPSRWQSVLLALARIESVMKGGAGFKAQPVPRLRPQWVQAADDGSVEFRLALALALQSDGFDRKGRPNDGVRRHWLPLAKPAGLPKFAVGGDAQHPRLERLPGVVMAGRNGTDDAIALVERRLVEATGQCGRGWALQAAPRAAASLGDLSAWLAGSVNTDRTLALARALMALDRQDWAEQYIVTLRAARAPVLPEDAWLCLRLAHLPWPLPDGRSVRCDPAIVRRLAAGDGAGAVTLALRRLQAAGVRPPLTAAAVAPDMARLWAAALAFPISRDTAALIQRRLDPSTHLQEALT